MAGINRLLSPLVIYAVLLLGTARATLRLDVYPAEVDFGLTDALDVNCTFDNDGTSGISALVSLILSHSDDSGQTFTELAGVNEFSPTTVNVATNDSVTTAGVVNQVGESFLHVRWHYPGEHESGIYQCSAQGMDTFGHTVAVTKTAQVTVDTDLDLKDFVDTIRAMKQQMVQMEQKLSTLETQRQKSLSEMFVLPPLNYDNKQYYISKNGYFDVEVSISICKIYGGELAEIDTAAELSALEGYMRTLSGVYVGLVAGNDKLTEGQWVLPFSGNPIPYVDWYPGYPQTSNDCMVLSPGYDHMWDEPCHIETPRDDYRFVCEMQ